MALSTTIISDRRGHQRHPFHTDAKLVLPDGHAVLSQTLDISLGGAAVVADINPPIGQVLTISMHLPARPKGSRLFESRAAVTSSILAGTDGGFRLGLAFIALDPASVSTLKGALP